jgi:FemAB-related protein (PEP-CTERM system-associated)
MTAGPVQVREVDHASAAAWNDHIALTPGGSFYHLHEWSKINRESFGHQSLMLGAYRDGRLAGALPLTLVASPAFGRILCSMPFVNYGGPCAAEPEVSRALVEQARALARERRVRYLELRCAEPLATDLPASTRKISMRLALAPDPDQVWNAYSSKHRTSIRRSYKNELAVVSGTTELLDTFYTVMEESWRNLGTPLYARSYFARILRTFPDRTRIFVCRQRDTPVAVAFNGYFNGTVEGMWAGGTAAARGLQANYVLYWEMIQDACKRGFGSYHLGRSTAESGAEDFKKKWNAQSMQLYWYTWRPDGGPLPELNVDNPRYRLAIATWKKLPLWATRLVGPAISRGIP